MGDYQPTIPLSGVVSALRQMETRYEELCLFACQVDELLSFSSGDWFAEPWLDTRHTFFVDVGDTWIWLRLEGGTPNTVARFGLVSHPEDFPRDIPQADVVVTVYQQQRIDKDKGPIPMPLPGVPGFFRGAVGFSRSARPGVTPLPYAQRWNRIIPVNLDPTRESDSIAADFGGLLGWAKRALLYRQVPIEADAKLEAMVFTGNHEAVQEAIEAVREQTDCSETMAKLAVGTVQLHLGSMAYGELVTEASRRVQDLGTEDRLREAYLMASLVSLRQRVEELESTVAALLNRTTP